MDAEAKLSLAFERFETSPEFVPDAKIACANADAIVAVAGNPVRFDDLGCRADKVQEAVGRRRRRIDEADAGPALDAAGRPAWRDDGAVADDHARGLKPAHAGKAGAGREFDSVREL